MRIHASNDPVLVIPVSMSSALIIYHHSHHCCFGCGHCLVRSLASIGGASIDAMQLQIVSDSVSSGNRLLTQKATKSRKTESKSGKRSRNPQGRLGEASYPWINRSLGLSGGAKQKAIAFSKTQSSFQRDRQQRHLFTSGHEGAEPSRYFRVKFEDMALEPVKRANQVYRWLGLGQMPVEVDTWLRASTSASQNQQDGDYGTTRDSAAVANKWEKDLDPQVVSDVSQECADVLHALEYPVEKFVLAGSPATRPGGEGASRPASNPDVNKGKHSGGGSNSALGMLSLVVNGLAEKAKVATGTKNKGSQKTINLGNMGPASGSSPKSSWTVDWVVLRQEQARLEKTYAGLKLLERALAHTGGAFAKQALHRAFLRLSSNGDKGDFRVGVVGGSVAAGSGKIGQWRFPEMLSTVLQQIFPKTKVRLQNSARGGTGSLTSGLCLETLVGRELDLILLEFALDDVGLYKRDATPFEMLVRWASTQPFLHTCFRFLHPSQQHPYHIVTSDMRFASPIPEVRPCHASPINSHGTVLLLPAVRGERHVLGGPAQLALGSGVYGTCVPSL